MANENSSELAAAILTLSQGVDTLNRMLRQTLTLSVDANGQKIPDSFIPKLPLDTMERFAQWKQKLESE